MRPCARGVEESRSILAVRARSARSAGWWLFYFVAAACLAGCSSLHLAPTVDPNQERRVLVTGYFERSVSAGKTQCESLAEKIGTVDCVSSGLRSAYFNVDQVLSGKLRARRVRVEYSTPYSKDADRLWVGAGKYQLVELSIDGISQTMSAHRILHQLQGGGWALPVIGEYDLEIVPCDLRGLARPLAFEYEPPKYRVDEYVSDFIAEAQASGMITVLGEFFYATQGIPVSDLRLILRNLSEIPDEAYHCY